MNEDKFENDINNVGRKVTQLDKDFGICQANKGKDIEQLQTRCATIEDNQKSMTGEIKDLVETQNKIFGALAVAMVILQIGMPVIMKLFFKGN
jgi:hypothetical protein